MALHERQLHQPPEGPITTISVTLKGRHIYNDTRLLAGYLVNDDAPKNASFTHFCLGCAVDVTANPFNTISA